MGPDTIDSLSDFAWLYSTSLVACAILSVPLIHILRPNPCGYLKFIRDNWDVKFASKAVHKKQRWLPHFFGSVFTTYFIGQSVRVVLHYPLLVNVMGASLLQVGFMDAITHLLAAVCDILVRRCRFKDQDMSRSTTFIAYACVNLISFTLIIGVMLPGTIDKSTIGKADWRAFALVFVAQGLVDLQLASQEFGEMRIQVNRDILRNPDSGGPCHWQDPKDIAVKLSQLQVVLRYPATVLASLVVSRLVIKHDTTIFKAYSLLGFLGFTSGAYMAWAWQGYTGEKAVPKVRIKRAAQLNMAILPGGEYFGIMLEVGFFNALLQITRSGYSRLLILRGLEMANVGEGDTARVIQIVYGISALLFWFSDCNLERTDDNGEWWKSESMVANQKKRTATVAVGVTSFVLMGLGHATLGVAERYRDLVLSGVVFGVGQATSTGLRTVWKDEVRALLRSHGHSESYRKAFIRILAGVGTCCMIANSLTVGIISEKYNLGLASVIYAFISGVGLLWNFRMEAKLRKELTIESEKMNSAVSDLLSTPAVKCDDDDVDNAHNEPFIVVAADGTVLKKAERHDNDHEVFHSTHWSDH